MHANSLRLMTAFVEKYASPDEGCLVYDVGSCDVNGTYRPLIEGAGFRYTGLDMADGPNVDVVVPEEGDWLLPEQSDITISGQCLEHTKRPWEWFQKVCAITKPGGLMSIIAPWKFHVHRYPVDCWRILPDGMQALFEWMDLEVLDVGSSDKDCYGFARKR